MASAVACAQFDETSFVDVPRDHWAYEALDALTNYGLLPASFHPLLGGNEPLSRYEMAVLVLQALQKVGATAPSTAAGAAGAEEAVPPSSLTTLEIARLRKLAAEFYTELQSLGVQMERVQGSVADLQARVDRLEAQEQRRDVEVEGYIQQRLTWQQAPGGDTTDLSPRRARIELVSRAFSPRGRNGERTGFKLSVDAARGFVLKDAYLTLDRFPDDHASIRVGQFSIPFGIDLPESSRQRLVVERALFAQDFFAGDPRDRGLEVARTSGRTRWALAVVNGTGANAPDDDSKKSVVLRVFDAEGTGRWGISGYLGTRGGAPQTLVGVDYRRVSSSGRFTLQGEAIAGQRAGISLAGGYLQVARQIGSESTAVVRLDFYDANLSVTGLRSQLGLGYLHAIDERGRIRLFYGANSGAANDLAVAEYQQTF